MRNIIYILLTLVCSTNIFANTALGIVADDDFLKVGVAPEKVNKAKAMVEKVTTNYKMLMLEKKQLELEVNRLILEGAEQNLSRIDAIFDRMGVIEATILKDRIRSQIEMQNYITQEQYIKARDYAVKRLEGKNKK